MVLALNHFNARSLIAASLLMIICAQVVDTTDNTFGTNSTEGCHAELWRMCGSEMHVYALLCNMGKIEACCKINYMICKYVLIAFLEYCTLHDETTMYGDGN